MDLTPNDGALPEPLARAIVAEEASSVRTLAACVDDDEERLGFARAVVHAVVAAYWSARQAASAGQWPLRETPSATRTDDVSAAAEGQAERIGTAAAALGVADAAYRIGVLYTGLMPTGFRARMGAYYTPPSLCEHLLDMAVQAGVDWRSARVLDPACGGGAFLAPAARRMIESLGDRSPKARLDSIQRRLHGFEQDAFAAWMSQVFLDAALADLYQDAGARLQPVVRVCDSLAEAPDSQGFDLVIGNPPYGRTKLPPQLREKFRRSLFGHANLYGVFTDLALRLTRPGGVIAYVTPTSFLSGEYFKALRGLLGREAPPVSIDFVRARRGVFADVLQETLLAAYRRVRDTESVTAPVGTVYTISARPDGSIEKTRAGAFSLPARLDEPWPAPRTGAQGALLRRANDLSHRLADYGYTVSTGPLVWNRHKPGLRDRPGRGRYPLVWAESVRAEGVFEFRARKRNHKPYFEPQPGEQWVVTNVPCVLLQRTTAKEQHRRLIAAELPAAFIEAHGAVVIENHLNMIKPLAGKPLVTPAALAALLNSGVVDQVFRCINGSVAVSAYELAALPLPPPEELKEVERLTRQQARRDALEGAVERLYVQAAE